MLARMGFETALLCVDRLRPCFFPLSIASSHFRREAKFMARFVPCQGGNDLPCSRFYSLSTLVHSSPGWCQMLKQTSVQAILRDQAKIDSEMAKMATRFHAAAANHADSECFGSSKTFKSPDVRFGVNQASTDGVFLGGTGADVQKKRCRRRPRRLPVPA